MLEEWVALGSRETRLLSDGRGQSLVWLHDTAGNRWTPGHERLSAALRVLAPSLPGFDDSTQLDGIDTPEDVVFWLLDLLAARDLRRPLLLGSGLGGWIAAEAAVRYPDRLGGLILVDAYGLEVEGHLAADEFALTPSMLRPLVFADPRSEQALAWLPDTEPPERAAAVLHARAAAARLAWQFPYDPKLRGRLPRATVPTLVLWGEQDRLVPTAHARAYADGLPRAELALIPGAAHHPYLEAPEAFAAAITRFAAALG